MVHQRGDVVVDNRGQLVCREAAVGYPRRQLGVPNKSVATDELAVFLCQSNDCIASGERESSLEFPFSSRYIPKTYLVTNLTGFSRVLRENNIRLSLMQEKHIQLTHFMLLPGVS